MDLNLFDTDHVKLTESLLRSIEGGIQPMIDVGIGIASIFLLVVVFVYVTNILDGGKFQAKMLVPLLIYFAICNFKLVAGPVINFANIIQSKSIEACKSVETTYIKDMVNTDTAEAGGAWSILKVFWFSEKDNSPLHPEEKTIAETFPDPDIEVEHAEANGTNDVTEESKHFSFKGLGANIGNALLNFFQKWGENILESFSFPIKFISRGAMGIVAVVIDWICALLQIAMAALGSIMTTIVVIFGPITWAFAVIPGNGKTIQAWFIRICQFALYAPIVSFLRALSIIALRTFASASADFGDPGSFYSAVGLVLALIAALMSVPAIASMIIEGAQGAVTLSQGIMTATNIMQAGGSMKMGRAADNMTPSPGGGGSSAGGGPTPPGGGGGTAPTPSAPPGGGGGTGMTGGTH